jgi:phage anti-repressor protein
LLRDVRSRSSATRRANNANIHAINAHAIKVHLLLKMVLMYRRWFKKIVENLFLTQSLVLSLVVVDVVALVVVVVVVVVV